MKLLKFYGEKMFDKSRGNNLVHKLILENRLSIKDVELEKINIPSQKQNSNFSFINCE